MVAYLGCSPLLWNCNRRRILIAFKICSDISRGERYSGPITKITVYKSVNLTLNKEVLKRYEVETGEYLRQRSLWTVEEGRCCYAINHDVILHEKYGLPKYNTTPKHD